jgi:hypothetical protein
MVRLVAAAIAALLVSAILSQSSFGQPESTAPHKADESELSKLIRDGKLYEFRIAIEDGVKISCPTLMTPTSCHFAIDSTAKKPKDLVLPPTHECSFEVVSRDGEDLKLKVELKRIVGLKANDTTVVWNSQNISEIKNVTLGREVTFDFPPHSDTSTGPMQVGVTVLPVPDRPVVVRTAARQFGVKQLTPVRFRVEGDRVVFE